MQLVLREMPLFIDDISDKLAQRQLDTVRKTTLESIHGKIKQQEQMDIAGCIKYAKTQKRDSYYD